MWLEKINNRKQDQSTCRVDANQTTTKPNIMIALIVTPMLAAAGFSLVYLLLGGGLGGAILIFIVAKMFGK